MAPASGAGNAAGNAPTFWDKVAAKQEEALEKVGYKFTKEEIDDRDRMKTTHDTMAGSHNAPEFELDAESAVRTPAFLGNTGMFDHSDMNYTKNQIEEDLNRARDTRRADDGAVRAFRAEAEVSRGVAPALTLKAPAKANKKPPPLATTTRRRRADAPPPAKKAKVDDAEDGAPANPLGLAYSDSDEGDGSAD